MHWDLLSTYSTTVVRHLLPTSCDHIQTHAKKISNLKGLIVENPDLSNVFIRYIRI